jgi:hypothetical protein
MLFGDFFGFLYPKFIVVREPVFNETNVINQKTEIDIISDITGTFFI